MKRILVIVTSFSLGVAAAYACKNDNDCPSGQECAESKSGKMKCYPKKTEDEKAPSSLKKARYVCDKGKCGTTTCFLLGVTYPCAACCWTSE